MTRAPAYKHVDELRAEFAIRGTAIRQRLEEFSRVLPAEYFYELAYCLLTPQSSAVNAGRAIEALRAARFQEGNVNAAGILFRKEHYIRFHNTKAKRLAELKGQFPAIAHELSNGSSSTELRTWLVRNVKGLGWKEASHFLRNIGHRDLAILDRHILKNLLRHGVLRSLPKSLSEKHYLLIEKKFRLFAVHTGISMDELDLLFWSLETGEILK